MARKRFGQNFLRDATVIDRIIAAFAPDAADAVVEVGPGHGELTRRIAKRVGQLTALEIDRDLVAGLRQSLAGASALEIVAADALAFDYGAHAARLGQPVRVIGNVAYNISSPLVFRVLAAAEAVTDVHFMLQKEVVDRIVAPAGSAPRGRLSVAVEARAEATWLFDVPAEAFAPAPRVTSAVVRLTPRTRALEVANWPLFERLLIGAFSQRRKTLRNALGAWLVEADIAACGVDPGLRPAALTAPDFARLANAAARRGSGSPAHG